MTIIIITVDYCKELNYLNYAVVFNMKLDYILEGDCIQVPQLLSKCIVLLIAKKKVTFYKVI